MAIFRTPRQWWNDHPPCNYYDVPAMEKWLEEQARRGRKLDTWPDIFVSAEPCACRFSIQPTPKSEDRPWTEPSAERREAYREAGWEYVCTTDYNAFQVWRSIRPDAEELSTDPAADSYAYRHLWKELRLRNSMFLVMLLAVDLFCLWVLIKGGHFLLDLLEGQRHSFLAFLWGSIALGHTVIRVRELFILKKTMDHLANGFPMEERKPYSRWKRMPMKLRAALVIGGVCLIFAMVPVKWESYRLKDLDQPPTYLSIEDLGGTNDLGIWLASRGEALLGCEVILIRQGDWKIGGQYRIWSEVQTNIYSVGILARPVLWEVVNGYVREDAGIPAEPFAQSVFEEAYYLHASDGVKHLAVREGGKVLYFRSSAPADLREHLEEIRMMMAWEEDDHE